MLKRGCGGGRAAKPPRRHLYLVLDDWSSGYSVRKIDLSSDSDCGDSDQKTADDGSSQDSIRSNVIQRLPSAVFRFEAQRGLPMYFAAAFDSKIMAMHPIARSENGVLPLMPISLVPVFDVSMRSFILVPRQIPDPHDPIYIPVGGRLFSLSTGSFQLLYPSSPSSDESDSESQAEPVWSWRALPEPPFERKYVTSYTIHPDGRTIFVSIKKHRAATTFTFDTAESTLADNCMWKQHGDWKLPFSGRAYFDSVLDAWVGLSGDPDTIGQLCSCDVASTSDAGDGQCPNVKLCKDLYNDNPVVRRVGATLHYMGNRSQFCLLECICIKGDSSGEMNDDCNLEEQHMSGLLSKKHMSGDRGYLFRLKPFLLMYDKTGDLKIGKHSQVRCYNVPEAVSESICKHPIAFWME